MKRLMATTTGAARDLKQSARHYPREVQVASGPITLRLMGEQDIDAVLAFAQTLPPDDLLYLLSDITQPPAVRNWVSAIKAGRTITVLALRDDRVVGEATLLHNSTSWRRHLGEIRIQISPVARRQGLARLLASEIDAIGNQLGLHLLTARMTLDQTAAHNVFRRLGFQREAVLWDYAITRDGKTRNVLVATKRLKRPGLPAVSPPARGPQFG